MKTKRKSKPNHKTDAAQRQAAVETGPDNTTRSSRLSPRMRLLISLGLAFHLLAVAATPLAVPPASELELNLARWLSWYSEPLFLNHGYRFFAPDPGPSDMMRVEIELPDGSRQTDLVYPNLEKQWPRLLYHRHFMLTSRLGQAPADPMGRALVDSYARHLFAKHEAKEVRIYGHRHGLATPDQVRGGVKLSDRQLYSTPYASPMGTWRGRSGSGNVGSEIMLEIGPPGTPSLDAPPQFASGRAKLTGRILGKDVQFPELIWQDGPRSVAFEDPRTGQNFFGQATGAHEMLLLYPLADETQCSILLEREPPPLVIHRGGQP